MLYTGAVLYTFRDVKQVIFYSTFKLTATLMGWQDNPAKNYDIPDNVNIVNKPGEREDNQKMLLGNELKGWLEIL